VKLHDHDVGELSRPGDAGLQRDLVDRTPDAVEADEPELDAAHVDHRDGTEARREDAVVLEQLVRRGDSLGA